ncbi:hypothetical protein ACWEQL_35880 [Kitasatospora sp. NPDC004240]
MSDFEDLVAAERRRASSDAARHAAEGARIAAREQAEFARWQQTADEVQGLLAQALRALRAAGAQPVPILAKRYPRPFTSVDRTVIIDWRWILGPFALDDRAIAYPVARISRLRDTWEDVRPYVRRNVQKSRLRTGLSAEQWVMWDTGSPMSWDVAAVARTQRLGCIGRDENGEPLLLPADSDRDPVPFKQYLARAVAHYRFW